MIMLMATFGQPALGLGDRARWTESACCRTTVDGTLNEVFLPQDEHQTMYEISLLKHVVVVLSKSEGPQKCLAPFGTDVHRVPRTIDVSILEKDSHRQHKMIMQNEVLRAQNM
jgi:hypothetical protein